ncbi:hypothetical protein FKW77_001140 [Venturia effusa]|uniref:Uncharacterized protein n=1 Tax=Venturia effusa TaxID=50376 RepID=A0A517LI90_9PEZI|nr:hypothetical protein FKW77_001140 [Venturia effusa]
MPPSRMFRGLRIPIPRNIDIHVANELQGVAMQAAPAPHTPDNSGIPISPITPIATQAAPEPQDPTALAIPISPITPVTDAAPSSLYDSDAELPDAIDEDVSAPLPSLSKHLAQLAAQLANPPYYIIFHLHFLCACGQHLTPGPKTSIKIDTSSDEDKVHDTLRERFSVDSGSQTLVFGDSTTGAIEICYDGLRGLGEYGIVKVILHDQKREMLVLERSADKRGKPIVIYEDDEERHLYRSVDDTGEILNVCPCNACKAQTAASHRYDMENDQAMLFSDDAHAGGDDQDWLRARPITRSSISIEAQRILANTTPEPFSSSPLDNEEVGMEDLNWDLESVVDEDSDDEDLRDERRGVWTNRARHPQPVSTSLNTTPPAKTSRLPSDEEWDRAAKRMRMMR